MTAVREVGDGRLIPVVDDRGAAAIRAMARGMRLVLLFVVAALAAAVVTGSPMAQTPDRQRPQAEEVPSIGVARMRPDGTIELYLRAAGPGGIVGQGLFEYPPTHPRYQDMLRHLGGMKPGEVKSVPPWPE